MAKNTKVVSLSMIPEMHLLAKRMANQRGITLSEFVRQKFEDFLRLPVDAEYKLRNAAAKRQITVAELVNQLVERFSLGDDSVQPIILKAPVEVLKDKEQFSRWMNDRSKALQNHLFPQT